MMKDNIQIPVSRIGIHPDIIKVRIEEEFKGYKMMLIEIIDKRNKIYSCPATYAKMKR